MSDFGNCRIAGCTIIARYKSARLCSKHYQRMKKHGSPEWEPPKMPETCALHGCGKPHFGKFLCNMHYVRLRNTGTTQPRVVRPAECEALGCKTETTRALCVVHYNRKLRHGDPNAKVRKWARRESDTCVADECDQSFVAHGYCQRHLHALNIGGRGDRHRARMRAHYESNKDYYFLRSHRRARSMRDGLTPEDLAETRAHRRRIKDDPCVYCGGSGEHYDHEFPVALGGTDRWTNIVRACSDCNWRKGAHCGTWFRLRQGVAALA